MSPETWTSGRAGSEKSAPTSYAFWRNPMTMIGAVLAYSSIIFLGCFFLIGLMSPIDNPYVGLWIYLVLPPFLITGLVLMPLGIWRRRRRYQRRVARNGERAPRPRLDLNLSEHRKAARFFVVTTALVVPVVAMTTYQGYHYTDSTQFCAKVCHVVMKPQFVAQQRSPHARVGCVECHIGSGAEWYVKSKLSGVRQVVAVLRNSYHRPIPPAITELRPAVETCQECHWPAKFFGDQLMRIAHYESDEANSPRPIEMIVKTGGGDPKTGPARGIHWHMALSNKIEYVATDDELQHIVWVRQTDDRGNQTVYRTDGRRSSDPKPEGIERTLDCMDCHNRAAHNFRPPNVAVDLALDAENMIDRTLPYIKREAVAAMLEAQSRGGDADEFLRDRLRGFYETNYPRVAAQRGEQIDRAIESVRDIYASTFFPDMNVDWRSYPDNIGHKNYPGCFRCHNTNMVTDGDTPIQHRCSACHTFLQEHSVEEDRRLIQAGSFVHPVPLAGIHADTLCSNCHTGGADPDPTCAGCHVEESAFVAGRTPEFARFGLKPGPLAQHACVACHELSQANEVGRIVTRCAQCHGGTDQAPAAQTRQLTQWNTRLREGFATLDRLMSEVDRVAASSGTAPNEARTWLDANGPRVDALRAAGPFHNAPASLSILQTLIGEARALAGDGRASATGG